MSFFGQLVNFTGIGGFCTVIQYGILWLLAETFGLSPVIASTIGYTISAIANYSLNRHFTFKSSRAHTEAFPRFVAVATIGVFFNGIVLTYFQKTFDLHYFLAQLAATLIVLLWNFLANRIWTFSANTK